MIKTLNKPYESRSIAAPVYFSVVLVIALVIYYVFRIKFPELLSESSVKDLMDTLYGSAIIWQSALFFLQCHKIYKKRSVEGLSLVMFMGFNIGQVLGIINGYAYRDWPFVTAYLSYFILSSYITWSILYYRVFNEKLKKLIYTASLVVVLLIVVTTAFLLSKHLRTLVDVFFSMAFLWNAFLYLAQIHKLHKEKRAGGIYIPLFIGFNAAFLIVWINGMIYKDWVLIYGNIMMIFLCATVVSMALWFQRRNKNG